MGELISVIIPLRAEISFNARKCAEERFDRNTGYLQVAEMVGELIG